MNDEARLNMWFAREHVTGVQAAYMLAGAMPVKNPRPNMKGSIRDWYVHILDAVKVERLATVGAIERRIEVSSEYLDSLTIEEFERFESKWEPLNHPSKINTERGIYHFLVKPATLVAWAEMAGWQLNSGAGSSLETPNAKGNGLRVAAIRLIKARSVSLGSTPHAAIIAMNEGLNEAGMGRPLSETSSTLRDAVALAKAGAGPVYPKKLPSNGREQIVALWKLVAHRYSKAPTDVDALLGLFDDTSISPPPRGLMEDLTESI